MYEIIKETNCQLLTWTPAVFCYPTSQSNNHNILLVKRPHFGGVKILKSKDFLNKISKTFRYQIDECPMFYMKGVASIDLINRVKSRTKDGSFYYCPTPDGFSGVVLAGEVEEYAFTYEPLSIGGTTPKSQGQNYRRNDAQSRKESEQFFQDNIRRTMHDQLAKQQYSPLVTLMTADYLLTANDLPGWPGKCFEISFENLIKQTFNLISTSYFDDAVIGRELDILRQIAIQHNLEPLFKNLLTSTVRKISKGTDIYGFAITNSIRFDGSELGITNIFDASLPVPFIYHFYQMFGVKEIGNVIKREFKIIQRSHRYKKSHIPYNI